MSPMDILQAYLDEAATAVLADDWATYRDGFSLPCAMISRDTTTIIRTEAALRAGYDSFRVLLGGQGVTDYIRMVETAQFLEKDLISGSYLSHILVSGHGIMPPFRSMLDLRSEGRRWRAAAVTNGLRQNQWPLMQAEPSVALDKLRQREGTEP